MSPQILPLTSPPKFISVLPLTRESFAPFGDAISNPNPSLHPSQLTPSHTQQTEHQFGFGVTQANQGSALRYAPVSSVRDLTAHAPSLISTGENGKPVMSMFVCAPRELSSSPPPGIENPKSGAADPAAAYFPVRILERHPFTTQTFIPLTSSPGARYLVIVAPTLAPSQSPSSETTLPYPVTASPHPGPGLPDLANLRAFIATTDQAVTYGAGTWHAPMVVLSAGDGISSPPALSFVVSQWVTGTPVEDCQEIAFSSASGSVKANRRKLGEDELGGPGVAVAVTMGREKIRKKLGSGRAKL